MCVSNNQLLYELDVTNWLYREKTNSHKNKKTTHTHTNTNSITGYSVLSTLIVFIIIVTLNLLLEIVSGYEKYVTSKLCVGIKHPFLNL